jgi:hypothetical protein
MRQRGRVQFIIPRQRLLPNSPAVRELPALVALKLDRKEPLERAGRRVARKINGRRPYLFYKFMEDSTVRADSYRKCIEQLVAQVEHIRTRAFPKPPVLTELFFELAKEKEEKDVLHADVKLLCEIFGAVRRTCDTLHHRIEENYAREMKLQTAYNCILAEHSKLLELYEEHLLGSTTKTVRKGAAHPIWDVD